MAPGITQWTVPHLLYQFVWENLTEYQKVKQSAKLKKNSYFSTKAYVVGAQRNDTDKCVFVSMTKARFESNYSSYYSSDVMDVHDRFHPNATLVVWQEPCMQLSSFHRRRK